MPGYLDASEWDALMVHLRADVHRIGASGAPLVRRSTLECEAYAKALAAVDTGFMRSAISSSFSGDGRNGTMTGSVTSHAGYSRWVEEGTSRMPPQPFMRPALRMAAPGLHAAASALGRSLLKGRP